VRGRMSGVVTPICHVTVFPDKSYPDALMAHVGLVSATMRFTRAVEFATLEWVDWFNTRRLLEPSGYVPPAEYEARYYEQAAVA
jgi:transposase InsO family protein